jgi:hypothetical protein
MGRLVLGLFVGTVAVVGLLATRPLDPPANLMATVGWTAHRDSVFLVVSWDAPAADSLVLEAQNTSGVFRTGPIPSGVVGVPIVRPVTPSLYGLADGPTLVRLCLYRGRRMACESTEVRRLMRIPGGSVT